MATRICSLCPSAEIKSQNYLNLLSHLEINSGPISCPVFFFLNYLKKDLLKAELHLRIT